MGCGGRGWRDKGKREGGGGRGERGKWEGVCVLMYMSTYGMHGRMLMTIGCEGKGTGGKGVRGGGGKREMGRAGQKGGGRSTEEKPTGRACIEMR